MANGTGARRNNPTTDYGDRLINSLSDWAHDPLGIKD
jgi:hypothetical protein